MLLVLLLACGSPPSGPSPEPPSVRDADLDPRDHAIPRSSDEPLELAYPPPEGFTRVAADPYTSWLRVRKIGPVFQALVTWRGDPVLHPGRMVRMGLTGYRQRALASVVRVRAEYLRDSTEAVAIPISTEEALVFPPDSPWDPWLQSLFDQLDADALRSVTAPVSTPRPGDFVLSPDHAAVILDVATRGEEVVVLVGEGDVPAQYFHVEHGPYVYWWPWDEEVGVEGFRVPLPASGLRRWQ